MVRLFKSRADTRHQEILQAIIDLGERIMPELDDLKAADAALDTAVSNGLAEIQRLVQKILNGLSTGVNPADLVPITQDLQKETAALQDAITTSQGQVPPV